MLAPKASSKSTGRLHILGVFISFGGFGYRAIEEQYGKTFARFCLIGTTALSIAGVLGVLSGVHNMLFPPPQRCADMGKYRLIRNSNSYDGLVDYFQQCPYINENNVNIVRSAIGDFNSIAQDYKQAGLSRREMYAYNRAGNLSVAMMTYGMLHGGINDRANGGGVIRGQHDVQVAIDRWPPAEELTDDDYRRLTNPRSGPN